MRARSLIFLAAALLTFSCGKTPTPEKLPETIREKFDLIQKEPQFIMYLNFKDMRKTDFWKNVIGDSVLKAESEFGGILDVFFKATGASISEGLDEFILANSWDEKNTIILTGVFNKDKLNGYVKSDSNFTSLSIQNTTVYVHKEKNLYFYLKENSLICASNYLSRLEETLTVNDTSRKTLNDNPEMIKIIQNTTYKNSIWLVTNQKTFIRGLLMNLTFGNKSSLTPDSTGMSDSSEAEIPDPRLNQNNTYFETVYQNINSLSLSTKMEDELKVMVQFEFVDGNKADEFTKILNGIITLARLTSGGKTKDEPAQNVLEDIEVVSGENFSYIRINITSANIEGFRKMNVIGKPEGKSIEE